MPFNAISRIRFFFTVPASHNVSSSTRCSLLSCSFQSQSNSVLQSIQLKINSAEENLASAAEFTLMHMLWQITLLPACLTHATQNCRWLCSNLRDKWPIFSSFVRMRNSFNIGKATCPHIQGTDGGADVIEPWCSLHLSSAFLNTLTLACPYHTHTCTSLHVGLYYWWFSAT